MELADRLRESRTTDRPSETFSESLDTTHNEGGRPPKLEREAIRRI